MVQSHMTKGGLRNYLKQSRTRGVYSYRRAIPEKLRPFFYKADGKLRGREWKEPLKTNSLNIALVLAANVNQLFEHTKSLAELELKKLMQPLNERETVEHFLKFLKKERIHPELAPSILATPQEQKAWREKQEKAIFEIEDLQTEFIDEIGHDFDGGEFIPQPMYYVLQEQIEFIKGRSNSIKSKLRPTWRSAYDGYVKDKVHDGRTAPDSLTKSKLSRTKRIAANFANYIGQGNVEMGWESILSEISRNDAKLYFENQIHEKLRKGSTVGRELAVLSAIYNHAVTEYKQDDHSLSSDGNPFAKLRTKAEDKYKDDVRLGNSISSSARAWTPKEVEDFHYRLPNMSVELKLISLISLHTGARLKDTTGLTLDDVFIHDEKDSFIEYRHNRNRKVSKDSIERKVPIFGALLLELKKYKIELISLDQKSFFPKYAGSRGSDSASNLLNQRHLDTINKEPSFRMHGLRKTLMAKFDAALIPNSISGYLIGWRDKTTVGMQEAYKSGYPHEDLLNYMKQAHKIKDWSVRY